VPGIGGIGVDIGGLNPFGSLLAEASRCMARLPRILLVEEGSTNHCTWRSHGHAFVLDSDEARLRFLSLLRKYKQKFGIEVLSYCLMGTHPHVMCRATQGQRAFSDFWKVVNWGFAHWYNRRTKGRGQVVMERLRSPRIQDGRHQLLVMRYGDLNPVRAGLVRSPRHWRWSSFRHYAYGEANDLITDAPEYQALGRTGPERRTAYLHLFATPLVSSLRSRRLDLVHGPFIGSDEWVAGRLEACGRSPPS
jgi:putative transposase